MTKLKCKFCGHVATRHGDEHYSCKATACLCPVQRWVIEKVEGLQT